MKTLRRSFYGVTRAFVWLRNICILHAPIIVLSDRCQTHQSCAFLCALSNSVYCATWSSGSQCLHVCPWWEYNISGWFVSLLEENTRLSPKTMCHDPFYFTVTDWFSKAELPCVNKAKWNMSPAAVLQYPTKTSSFFSDHQCWVSYFKKRRPYQGNLQHVQLNPLLWLALYASTKEAKKDTAVLTYHWLGSRLARLPLSVKVTSTLPVVSQECCYQNQCCITII